MIKQNMQLLSYGKPYESVREIWRIRGVKGFYAGYLPLLFRELPFSFIQLPVFEFFQRLLQRIEVYTTKVKNRLRKYEEKVRVKTILSGGMAGMIAGLLITPCDVIKMRMMTNTVKEYKVKPWGWVRKIINEEGSKGLFKGWHIRIINLGFGGMVYFTCYRTFIKIVGAEKLYKEIRK